MKKTVKCLFIGAFTGVVNGLFGSGGGCIAVPCFEKLLGEEEQRAHATAIAVILPLSVISAALYISRVSVDLFSVVFVSLGGIAGGIVGAKLLDKMSGSLLHIIFGITMLAGAVRMIL